MRKILSIAFTVAVILSSAVSAEAQHRGHGYSGYRSHNYHGSYRGYSGHRYYGGGYRGYHGRRNDWIGPAIIGGALLGGIIVNESCWRYRDYVTPYGEVIRRRYWVCN